MAIDPKYFLNLQGRMFVTFAGLLDHAHKLGLRSIETTLVQTPHPDNGNVAIHQAIVTFTGEDGFVTWSAYGDAGPQSLKPNMIPATLRMSETRSIARALRWATNVGETAFDELGPDASETERPEPAARPVAARQTATFKVEQPAEAASDAADQRLFCQAEGCGVALSDKEAAVCRKLSQALEGGAYCASCRSKAAATIAASKKEA